MGSGHYPHLPVLLEEALTALAVRPGGNYIDCTLGVGGHAQVILERCTPGGRLLGIEKDPQAIAIARERLAPYGDAALLVHDGYERLGEIVSQHSFHPVQGILFDLGLSSLQLEEESRGFSFQKEGPLDMRFDPQEGITAADILNTLPEHDLAYLLRLYGEEAESRRIAHAIVASRPLATTRQLANIIERATHRLQSRIHPATRTFQALRIAVNRELEALESALIQAVDLLEKGGHLVVISFHSLEDRIVKNLVRQEAQGCICPPGLPTCVCGRKARLRIVNRKVITPSLREVEANPRSRSAKMRVAEHL